MMGTRMVYAAPATIENLYFKRDWQKVLEDRGHIRIPTENPIRLDDYIRDQPDSVWELIDRVGIKVHENDPLIDAIKEEPSAILSSPNDIYFIDRKTKEDYLKQNPGVQVFTEESESVTPLTVDWVKSPDRDEMFSWRKFFAAYEEHFKKPLCSNSIILVDRYILKKFESGLYNIKDMLDAILPASMHGEYHILIVTDDSQVMTSKKVSIEDAVKRIQKLDKWLNRPYPLIIEVFMIRPLGEKREELTKAEVALRDIYAKTHDRHVYSNYFIVSASKSLRAVKMNLDKEPVSSEDQDITFKSIYNGINNPIPTDLPYKSCDKFITAINKYIKSDDTSLCKYYINGVEGDVKNIKNRLLK